MLSLLEEHKNNQNIVLIQEPPWRLICRTVSTSNPEGEPVIGAPTHRDWLIMFRRPKNAKDNDMELGSGSE